MELHDFKALLSLRRRSIESYRTIRQPMRCARALVLALLAAPLVVYSRAELAGLPAGGVAGKPGAKQKVSLGDILGPVVIGKDGSTARIANWGGMTDAEKERTLRIVGARNRRRVALLRGQGKDVKLQNGREEL